MIDALYVQVGPPGREVARTIDHSGCVLVDVDAEGRPIGVEILGAEDIRGERVLSRDHNHTDSTTTGSVHYRS